MGPHQNSLEMTTPNGNVSTGGSQGDAHNLDSKFGVSKCSHDSLHAPKTDLEKGLSGAHIPMETDIRGETKLERDEDTNIIRFNEVADPGNPMNWSLKYKLMITAILASMTFITTFTSAIFSTAVEATSRKFQLSTEVMTLGTSLFLLGFGFGPIMWGPLSELYGRRLPLYVGTLGMCLFQVGVAVALNAYTIMICRFFAGLFGSAPLAVVGGSLADFWDPVARGVTVGIYTMCTFVGPVAAPIMGGYIVESYLGWRWTEYISVIMGK